MPAYDFKCDQCGRVREYRIKFADYNDLKNNLLCVPLEDKEFAEALDSYCPGKMVRQMDFSGHFALSGSGWHGREGEGTGYEITQNEMDRNLEQSARDEDTMRSFMQESQKYEEGE